MRWWLIALFLIFEVLFLVSSEILVDICLIDERWVLTLENVFILEKRGSLIGFELSMLIYERHTLILSHISGYHLFNTHDTLHISSIFTAIFNEQLWITLVQPFEFSNQCPLLSLIEPRRICGVRDISMFDHRVADSFGLGRRIAFIVVLVSSYTTLTGRHVWDTDYGWLGSRIILGGSR